MEGGGGKHKVPTLLNGGHGAFNPVSRGGGHNTFWNRDFPIL